MNTWTVGCLHLQNTKSIDVVIIKTALQLALAPQHLQLRCSLVSRKSYLLQIELAFYRRLL